MTEARGASSTPSKQLKNMYFEEKTKPKTTGPQGWELGDVLFSCSRQNTDYCNTYKDSIPDKRLGSRGNSSNESHDVYNQTRMELCRRSAF